MKKRNQVIEALAALDGPDETIQTMTPEEFAVKPLKEVIHGKSVKEEGWE